MKPVIATMLLLCAMSISAAEEPGATITPGVGLAFFGSDRNLDNDNLFSLRGGYRFDSPWAIELGYLTSDPDVDTGVGGADISAWHLDGLYHFGDRDMISPFLSFGVGKGEADYGAIDVDESMLNLGVGAKYFFAERTALRTDVKLFRGSDTGDLDIGLIVSLHHNFGNSAKAAPVATVPADSDRDGVLDENDRCPQTPAGAPVDARGCALDSDGDGVADYMDDCPDTSKRGARIDAKGCYVVLTETVRVELKVEFELNSADTRPEHREEVARVYQFMQEYPGTRVTIEGHTDSLGNADYNRDLSQRRAQSVADMLINDFGMSASRVNAMGYGEDRPVASNETAEGRQQNRRVVGVVETVVEKIETN